MSGIYYIDLIATLQAAGVTCQVNSINAGWEYRARGSGGFPSEPLAIFWHHTASSTSVNNDLSYMIDGSPDAPVGNMLLDRDGVVWPIAAGREQLRRQGRARTRSAGAPSRSTQGNTRGWQHRGGEQRGRRGLAAGADRRLLQASTTRSTPHFGNQPTDLITHARVRPPTGRSTQPPPTRRAGPVDAGLGQHLGHVDLRRHPRRGGAARRTSAPHPNRHTHRRGGPTWRPPSCTSSTATPSSSDRDRCSLTAPSTTCSSRGSAPAPKATRSSPTTRPRPDVIHQDVTMETIRRDLVLLGNPEEIEDPPVRGGR